MHFAPAKKMCFFLFFFQPFDQVIAIVLFWCLSSIYQDMAFFLIFERTNNSVRTSENGQGGTKTYVIKIKLEYVQMARTICTGHCLKCGSTFNVSLPNSLSTALRRTMLQQRGLTTQCSPLTMYPSSWPKRNWGTFPIVKLLQFLFMDIHIPD